MPSEYLLQEDDCAPDAREAFDKALKNKFNLCRQDFFDLGKKVMPDEITIEWHYVGYILSYHGDDPYFKLQEIV